MKPYLWYIGFIVGAATTGLCLKMAAPGMQNLWRSLIAAGVGVLCGWYAEVSARKPKDPRDGGGPPPG